MQRGLPSKRYMVEHQVLPGLDNALVQNMHKSLTEDVKVLYSFSNLDEKRMYTVIESNDELTIESFLSEMRVPFDTITEIHLQCEGRKGVIEDLRATRKAA